MIDRKYQPAIENLYYDYQLKRKELKDIIDKT